MPTSTFHFLCATIYLHDREHRRQQIDSLIKKDRATTPSPSVLNIGSAQTSRPYTSLQSQIYIPSDPAFEQQAAMLTLFDDVLTDAG